MTPLRFSLLKKMSQSPLHYRYAALEQTESTRPMRVGTITHQLVLGPQQGRPVLRFEGEKRQGKAWDTFLSDAPPGAELVTAPEWRDAEPIAEAVLTDPVAARILKGSRREVPLTWNDAGFDCSTGGVDVVGDNLIADLKVTNSADPHRFMTLAARMHYHCQMAWYQQACRANGINADNVYLIAVESSAPYPVTVFKLGEDVLREGRKLLVLWMERLRSCIDNDLWPAYSQTEVEFTLPSWSYDAEEEDSDG